MESEIEIDNIVYVNFLVTVKNKIKKENVNIKLLKIVEKLYSKCKYIIIRK